MNNIKKLKLSSDLELCKKLSDEIVEQVGWGKTNQIGLRSRLNTEDQWFDGAGSLYDRGSSIFKNTESEFTEWNLGSNHYIRQQVERLQELEKFSAGRVRIMKLLPKTGLSVHSDNEVRYHLVLKTNNKAVFAFNNGMLPKLTDYTEMGTFYHIPADSHWYWIDTRQVHWVYNGGIEDRIHIVVCSTM
jgi:hypothetical protein